MNKPTKKYHTPKCYHYCEMIDYIESKYKIKTRGYKRELDGEYRDFWHWLLEHNGISNGSMGYFPDDWEPWWIHEIMSLIVKEFYPNYPDEDLNFWVSW